MFEPTFRKPSNVLIRQLISLLARPSRRSFVLVDTLSSLREVPDFERRLRISVGIHRSGPRARTLDARRRHVIEGAVHEKKRFRVSCANGRPAVPTRNRKKACLVALV